MFTTDLTNEYYECKTGLDVDSDYPPNSDAYLYTGRALKGWINQFIVEDYFKVQKSF